MSLFHKSKKVDRLQKAPEVWEVVEPGLKFGTSRLKSVLLAITVHALTTLVVHFYFVFVHYSLWRF